jgi:hypothetical protein
MKPAGIVAAACPDSTACYKGQTGVPDIMRINLIIVGQAQEQITLRTKTKQIMAACGKLEPIILP